MIIQKKIEVGVLRKQPPQVVDLVQFDTGIQLVFIVADFEIPAETTAMLYVQKPSGKFVYQESGITVSGNAVTVDLENQALTEYGVAGYQLQLTNGEDRISTFAGILRVEKSFADTNAEESKSVITGFDTAITKRVAEFMETYFKENPVSDGEDGKSAYEYAKDGGFGGTEEEFADKLAKEYLPLSGGTMTGELGLKQGGVGLQLGTSGNICATDTHNGGGTTRTILGAGIHWATDAAVEDEMTVGHPAFHLAMRGSRERPTYCQGTSKANNTELALLEDVNTKAPKYDYGKIDLTPGASVLETGKLYFVYE